MPSYFFAFEGIDGTGKSTQQRLLSDWLRHKGHNVVTCRDPGSTPLGERLREVVLGVSEQLPTDATAVEIDDSSETLIYMAARAQLVRQIIRPALAEGKTVISDRFLLSTLAYQGYGGGQSIPGIREVGRYATDGVLPQLTFVLDLPPEIAAGRLKGGMDRMESKGIEYFRRVRSGFLSEAKQSPQSIVVIDAQATIEEIHEDVLAKIRTLFM